jgi:hypothetical protein
MVLAVASVAFPMGRSAAFQPRTGTANSTATVA